MDDAAVHADPIADRGKVGRVHRLVPKPAADLGPAVGVAGNAIKTALLFDDACKAQIAAAEARGLVLEKQSPAKAFA